MGLCKKNFDWLLIMGKRREGKLNAICNKFHENKSELLLLRVRLA
jgi:hypothetical protein